MQDSTSLRPTCMSMCSQNSHRHWELHVHTCTYLARITSAVEIPCGLRYSKLNVQDRVLVKFKHISAESAYNGEYSTLYFASPESELITCICIHGLS